MGIYRAISKTSMADLREIKGFSILTNSPEPLNTYNPYSPQPQQVQPSYIVEFIVGSARMKSDVFYNFDELKLYLKKLLNVKL